MRAVGRLLALAVVVLVLTACTRAGGPPEPSPSSPPTAAPSAVGGGSAPDPGSGVTSPPGSSADPGPPEPVPTLVSPKPGRLDVHPVGATAIDPLVDGRHVTVRLSWWSGVAPCSVLDSVRVTTEGSAIRLTILEGSDEQGVACIEIAMFKATLVDLGQLAPGRYSITAGGDAPPAIVTVH